MKKIKMVLVSMFLLMVMSACQSSTNETLTSTDFVEQFIMDYLTIKYDEGTVQKQVYNQLSEKIEPYFTEDCYQIFTTSSYGMIPIQAADKYQSDITVKDIQLEESFNEQETMGYNVDVTLVLPDDVANISLTLSVRKQNDSFQIYAIQFFNIDEALH